MEIYDLLIVGAGTAGASGAMYASRLHLKTVMVAQMPGGLITTTHIVENWPGIRSITGTDLATSILDHAASFGATFKNETVLDIEAIALTEDQQRSGKKSGFIVRTASAEYLAKTVLLATGSQHKKLGLPSEQKFENRGLAYCALCDAAFFRNKPVAIVGGGNTAAKESLLLAEQSSKVYIISRSALHSEPIIIHKIKENEKIELLEGVEVAKIIGDERVQQIKLNDGKILDVEGLFVAIGFNPNSDLAEKLGVHLNSRREIIINRKSETNIPGVFAAGDVCNTSFKQAIIGATEAITASYHAFEYIQQNEIILPKEL